MASDEVLEREPLAVKALACAGLLVLCACQGTIPTYGFQPLAGQPAIPSGEADATCLGRAAAAKRAAAADIWAGGGEPAYHQTYAACMASFGWKRIVVSSYRYG